MKLKIKKVSNRAVIPSYQHPGEDACFDMSILIDGNENIPMQSSEKGFSNNLSAIDNGSVHIPPFERYVFHTGLSFEIETGYVMRIYDRSSTGIKKSLILSNGTGIIDSNYRGEVMIALTNVSNNTVTVSDLDRIAQAEIAKVIDVEMEVVEELSDSSRGKNGFGSTGNR